MKTLSVILLTLNSLLLQACTQNNGRKGVSVFVTPAAFEAINIAAQGTGLTTNCPTHGAEYRGFTVWHAEVPPNVDVIKEFDEIYAGDIFWDNEKTFAAVIDGRVYSAVEYNASLSSIIDLLSANRK